jgi:hypothetical protein
MQLVENSPKKLINLKVDLVKDGGRILKQIKQYRLTKSYLIHGLEAEVNSSKTN